MSSRAEAEEVLRSAGRREDAEIDLAEVALAFASLDRPGVALASYRTHLDELAGDVASAYARPAAGVDGIGAMLSALSGAIHRQHGYRGDTETYDDLQNANLMRVIDRRRGLPITLGILYLHTARRHGWRLAGLNFPGHFLLRLEDRGRSVIIDPFGGGRIMEPEDLRGFLKRNSGPEAELRPEHHAPASNLQILLRLQNNIKVRLLAEGRVESALAVVDSLLLLAPGVAMLWHEAGLLHARLGSLRAAIVAFQHAVELAADATSRQRFGAQLEHLRSRLN
ncbi:MAG: SirB1 family protein [Alphaproteobacteria bacterium]